MCVSLKTNSVSCESSVLGVPSSLHYSTAITNSCSLEHSPTKRMKTFVMWEQWWHSGESTRLPPMWPGFTLQTRCYMWVDFVGSLLCSERFFPGYSGFSPLLKNLHLIKFDLINLICTGPNKL